jgi:hypothetical protein
MRLAFLLLSLVQIVFAAMLFGKRAQERRWFRWALVAVLLVSGLGWSWVGMRDLVAFETGGRASSAPASFVDGQLTEHGELLGLVQRGELLIVAPAASAGSTARLTEISMVESVGPESREISLLPYEGLVLVVSGQDGGGWIYEAEVVEQGGPLISAIVQRAYGSGP